MSCAVLGLPPVNDHTKDSVKVECSAISLVALISMSSPRCLLARSEKKSHEGFSKVS